jgi:hypothetical protein
MTKRRILAVLGLGAALSLAPLGTTAAQATEFTNKPILREVWINVYDEERAIPLDGEVVPAAHIPRLPE